MRSRSMKNVDVVLSSEEFALHINGCSRNKRDSQKKIYASFYRQAFEICEHYANSNEEVIEILNKGFLKIFEQLAFFSPPYANELSSFQDWLYEIMIDEANSHYGKKNKRQVIVGLGKKIFDNSELIKTG